MSNELLHDRRVALEEAFFARQNETLLRQLRELDQARRKKAALSAASGIIDDTVLNKLVALDIGCNTLAALSLTPLVAVAWADGNIDDKERSVAFSEAAEMGVARQDIAHQLFETWLAEPPPPELLAAWKDYIGALSATLSPEADLRSGKKSWAELEPSLKQPEASLVSSEGFRPRRRAS